MTHTAFLVLYSCQPGLQGLKESILSGCVSGKLYDHFCTYTLSFPKVIGTAYQSLLYMKAFAGTRWVEKLAEMPYFHDPI